MLSAFAREWPILSKISTSCISIKQPCKHMQHMHICDKCTMQTLCSSYNEVNWSSVVLNCASASHPKCFHVNLQKLRYGLPPSTMQLWESLALQTHSHHESVSSVFLLSSTLKTTSFAKVLQEIDSQKVLQVLALLQCWSNKECGNCLHLNAWRIRKVNQTYLRCTKEPSIAYLGDCKSCNFECFWGFMR